MNAHTTQPDDGLGIPAGLDRKSNGVQPANATAAKLTSTAPTAAKPNRVEQIKAAAASVAAKPNRKERRAAASTKQPAKAKAKPAKAPAVSAATDKPAPEKRSIVPASYKEKYAEHNDTCGSSLSMFLKEQTTGKNADGREALLVDELFAIAKANEIDVTKYVGLNNGQKRMNVYNRLVGRLNDGKDVKVGKRVFRAADHKPTEAKKPAAKSVAKAKRPAKSEPAQLAA